jgi:hypothetical protein
MGIAGPITEKFGTRATLNGLAIIFTVTLTLPFLVKEVRQIKAN